MRLKMRLTWLIIILTNPFLNSNLALCANAPRLPGELVWSMRYDPKTFDPAKVDDEASEMLRFLTAGVLLRINRQTQQPEPELATSWNVSPDGRIVSLRLRENLHFSDGRPLTSRDVVWSLRHVLLPATNAPIAEEFLVPQEVNVEAVDALSLKIHLAKRVIGIAKILDQIAIEPAEQPSEGRITSGPFTLTEYKRGQSVRLQRNPYYWKHDVANVQLPYALGIRIDILNNREREISLFQQGEYDFIDGLQPEYFETLNKRLPGDVRNLGPSLNTEQLWFNQAAKSSLPEFEKTWFQNRSFRVAVSKAIHRADMAKVAYNNFATPAYGFISPANTRWYNANLQYPHEDLAESQRLLSKAGFQKRGDSLYDAQGNPVRFSILTNAGNDARKKMATMIQQDLAAIGIQVTVVTLDFPALIDRIMHTQSYEACLLGLVNVDPDPDSMSNLWLSSSSNHQWNPSEKTPATPWESEIDDQIKLQATSQNQQERKRALDRVQQIVADQQPFIYLVYPNILHAVSTRISGVHPLIFQPGLVWNIDMIHPRKEN